MELTKDQLKKLLPKNPYIDNWHSALSQLLPEYNINTPQRIAAFVAQCAHESGNFMVLRENLNYRAPTLRKIFPKYFPTDAMANEYASKPNKQEAIANLVYANRMSYAEEHLRVSCLSNLVFYRCYFYLNGLFLYNNLFHCLISNLQAQSIRLLLAYLELQAFQVLEQDLYLVLS